MYISPAPPCISECASIIYGVNAVGGGGESEGEQVDVGGVPTTALRRVARYKMRAARWHVDHRLHPGKTLEGEGPPGGAEARESSSRQSSPFHSTPSSPLRQFHVDGRCLYGWCRRTDELVDGPNSQHITSKALERWDERLHDLFQGRPYDMYDAALSDTISSYPIHIQPFKDMIEGMRIDLGKTICENFEELYLYCYYVAGTVGLMSVPVMGISSSSTMPLASVYAAALSLGVASQLTNIIRDVGEDARRGRIYLPQDELSSAGLSDDDVFKARVGNRWRRFMKKQISRARMLFSEARNGVSELDPASRWAVSASLMLYKNILDFVEANDYDNFTRRASVCGIKKLLLLPRAYIMCGRPLSHFEYFLLQPDHNQQSHVL